MKRSAQLVFLTVISLICSAVPSSARINLFEPWYPGIDSRIAPLYSYQASAGLNRGERMFEVPVAFTYISHPRVEMGGRWGMRSVAGKTGINDLLLGVKYQFLEETPEQPYIVGETAISLPTANSDEGLGSGTVGMLLDWSLEKKFDPATGYFGLGVQLNSENSDKDRPGNIFSYRAGASYPYREDVRLYGEFKGFNHGISRVGGIDTVESYQELYLAPGASYVYDKKTVLSAAILIGLTPDSHHIGILIAGTF